MTSTLATYIPFCTKYVRASSRIKHYEHAKLGNVLRNALICVQLSASFCEGDFWHPVIIMVHKVECARNYSVNTWHSDMHDETHAHDLETNRCVGALAEILNTNCGP